MKTDIIYLSRVKKTKEEVLIYKTFYDKYKDFRTSREFDLEELENFITLTNILGIENSINVSKNQVVQIYYECKNAELLYHSVYIGDLAIAKKNNEEELILETIAKNIVFRKYNNYFIDIQTYEKYKDSEIIDGKIFVTNARLIKDVFNNELPGTKQSKQKILTFCKNKFSEVS